MNIGVLSEKGILNWTLNAAAFFFFFFPMMKLFSMRIVIINDVSE